MNSSSLFAFRYFPDCDGFNATALTNGIFVEGLSLKKIASMLQTPLGPDYKDCLIIKNEHYSLPGVRKSFSSLKELTGYYQQNKLLLADVPVKLSRCCPPRSQGR